MPTVNELLKRLPEVIADRVRYNMDDDFRDSEFEDCAYLISNGFFWYDRPEGYDFWRAVYEDCVFNKI